MRVLGYVRVSTAAQEHGIEAQRRAILAEVERRDWTVTFIEDAGRSGKDIERPGITEALELLRTRQVDALVVSKLDRLSRSLVDFARLIDLASKQGWGLIALDLNLDTSTPTGKLVASVMAAVAQWERETIGLRTKEALAAAKAKGVKVGRPASQDPAVVRRIRRAREHGMTHRAIAEHLNADREPLPGGGARWHANSVRSAEGSRPSRRQRLNPQPSESQSPMRHARSPRGA